MAASEKKEVDKALRRLEELIETLETHPDPVAGNTARELVARVLELHGLGLAKLMAVVARAGAGDPITARLAQDEHIRAMLLLHGLHPEDLETRVRNAVEGLWPHLGVLGLRLEVAKIASGAVYLRLHGSGKALAPAILWTLPGEIEDAIFEAAPDAVSVIIEGSEFASPAIAGRAAE